uniref:Uncharacterized protein n=1 Tax=Nelumbo nucifera TaxID=4432 RepID=A0A822YFN9_NELNU|nr:TPA_asm: hypothetical protein HUJ06_010158 [Nelumbo nucifera]
MGDINVGGGLGGFDDSNVGGLVVDNVDGAEEDFSEENFDPNYDISDSEEGEDDNDSEDLDLEFENEGIESGDCANNYLSDYEPTSEYESLVGSDDEDTEGQKLCLT